jgi:methyl-accepting chemotaxis protein
MPAEFTMTDDSRTVFDKATEAVHGAAETVQATTESIASAIEDSRRPGGVLDQVSRFTRQAPLRSLAIAFVLGVVFARRR